MRHEYTVAQLPYFAFFKLPLADDSESSTRSNLRRRSRNIRRQGMSVLGDKGKRKRKKGAEGCCASAMYAARVIPRDVYAKDRAGLSPFWK